MLSSQHLVVAIAFGFTAAPSAAAPAPLAPEKGADAKDAGNGSKKPERGQTIVRGDLPLAQLLRANRQPLFGSGKLSIEGESIKLSLDRDGAIGSTFEGRGVMDSKHDQMKGSNRRFIRYGDQKDGEKLLPGLAAVGIGRGAWMSRFPLAGETKVRFKMRIPNLLTSASTFKVCVNWDDDSGYEVNSLNAVSLISDGQPRGGSHRSPDREYREHMARWFPRKGESVPVEIAIADGVLAVKVAGKETVSAPVKDDGGRVAFFFDKIVFTIQDLEITGKVDRDWCDSRLDELEKAGKLALEEKPEDDPALASDATQERAEEPAGGQGPER